MLLSSVGRLAGWFVGGWVVWLVGGWVGRWVGWLVGEWVGGCFGWLVINCCYGILSFMEQQTYL
jgi:hypothetical protein